MLTKRWFWKVARILNEGTRYFSEKELKQYVNDYWEEYLASIEKKERTFTIESLMECLNGYEETALVNELVNATTF